VTWPKDTELSTIVVSVLGGPDNTVYATASPGGDGTFLTERVPPGTYQLQAYAYTPQTPERLKNSSPILPSFQGQVKVEVPAEGEVQADDLALIPIGAVNKPAEADKPAAEKPADKQITIRGKVVDDDTGEPIAKLVVQGGMFDPADPQKVTWGFTETRSDARDGSFSATIKWDKGWTARIVADGYIPQPVLTSAPPADNDISNLTIRLKRGRNVHGVVLDHAGKPVKDAAVFAIGPTALNLVGGHDIDHESQAVRTDVDGRFELPIGEAKSLVVSHAAFDAWPAAIPDQGDVTVRLPEPARVDIELSIDGADKESVIFYQLLTQDRPEFAGVQSLRGVNIANPGKLSLTALPPGKYQLSRNVMNHLPQIVTAGAMLDRQFFELKAGETKSIDFVREQGARVRGKVTWPADTKLAGIVVSIQGVTKKAPFDDYEWTTTYASQTAAADGTYLTERISPGTYLLVVDAYKPPTPATPEERSRLGFGRVAPSFHAQVKIEVPAEGELTAPDLTLKAIPPASSEVRWSDTRAIQFSRRQIGELVCVGPI
jgi:hypothetical protein